MAPDIHPNDLAEIATILARRYLRYRDSLRKRLTNCLASAAGISPHVPVVNDTENHRETANTMGEDA